MEINCIAGIDCGVNGGIAIYKDGQTTAHKMPQTATELAELFKGLHPVVFVEKVNIRKDDAERAGKLCRVEAMIRNSEMVKTTLELLGIPFALIHSASWQTKLAVRQTGEEYLTKKHRFKDIAQAWYPQIRVTLWNADALLILSCGRKLINNKDRWLKTNLPKNAADLLLKC